MTGRLHSPPKYTFMAAARPDFHVCESGGPALVNVGLIFTAGGLHGPASVLLTLVLIPCCYSETFLWLYGFIVLTRGGGFQFPARQVSPHVVKTNRSGRLETLNCSQIRIRGVMIHSFLVINRMNRSHFGLNQIVHDSFKKKITW